jgi:N-acyl-D-amino-acid deacylase
MKSISRREFLKYSSRLTAAAGLGGCGIILKGCRTKQEFDLVIKGGLIYDGEGREAFQADIGIVGNNIQEIGRISSIKGKAVIDANGLSICPGFIDVHDHTDISLLINPKAESHVRQGITTVVSGNCGASPFPIAEEIYDEIKANYQEQFQLDLTWSDLKGFLLRLEKTGMALNYATLVGHGTIRGAVMGFHDRPSKTDELLKMKTLLEENIINGAVGFSTGLEYAPGSFAPANEITELCYVVSRLNGVYATHMRSEGDFLMESLEESIDVSRKTGVSLEISHFKVAYPPNWHKIDDAIAKVEEAKQEGIDIACDRYPYIAGSTGLSFYMPLWARQGTTDEFLSRLKDPTVETRLREYVDKQEKKLGSWDKVLISDVVTDKNKQFVGMSVLQAQKHVEKDAFEFMRDILIEERGRVGMVTFMMKEENLKKILAHPLVGIGCDGSAMAPYGPLGEGKPHPRSYGSFPRVLGKYVRDEKIISMTQMIKKITSNPAKKFGFEKRGVLQTGYNADIVIFDEANVIDQATFEQPHQYSRGIEYVLVNGQVVINREEHTGNLPGQVLRKKAETKKS